MADSRSDVTYIRYDFIGIPHLVDADPIVEEALHRARAVLESWRAEAEVLTDRHPLAVDGASGPYPPPLADEMQVIAAWGASEPAEGCQYAEVMVCRSHDVVFVQALAYAPRGDPQRLRSAIEAREAGSRRGVDLGSTVLVQHLSTRSTRPSSAVATRAGALGIRADEPRRREYMLFTPSEQEDAANAVIQWSGRPGQIHTFPALEIARWKTLYESAEYAAAQAALTATERRLRTAASRLATGGVSRLRGCIEEPRGEGARRLTDETCEVIDSHGHLTAQLALLDDLVGTVEVNVANHRRAAAALRDGDGGADDLLAVDARAMEDLLEQLRIDSGYRESTATRASAALDSARGQLELLRLQRESERAELAGIEASLLAAVGTGLALFEVTLTIGVRLPSATAIVLLACSLVFCGSRRLLGAGTGALSYVIGQLATTATGAGLVATVWSLAMASAASEAVGLATVVVTWAAPVVAVGVVLRRGRQGARRR